MSEKVSISGQTMELQTTSIVCAVSPEQCKPMHSRMALVRGFPCHAGFRHVTCCVVLQASYLAVLLD